MTNYLPYILLLIILGCVSVEKQSLPSQESGNVEGRFFILKNTGTTHENYSDLSFYLISRKDTVAKSTTNREFFKFEGIKPGEYSLFIKDLMHPEIISIISDKFNVYNNEVTLITSSATGKYLHEKASKWCVYHFKKKLKKGDLIVHFQDSLFDTGDTVRFYVETKKIEKETKLNYILTVPKSREVNISLNPGVYEITSSVTKNRKDFYSKAYLSAVILPDQGFSIHLDSFQRLDMNIYLFENFQNPNYKIYKNCLK